MVKRALVFLVDSSGSMDELFEEKRKIDRTCEAVLKLLMDSDRLSEDDLISIMFFHATKSGDVPKVDVLFPPTRLGNLKSELSSVRRKLSRVKPAGGTPIGFGLSCAIEALSKVDADEKRVILLTDGENNVGIPPEEAASEAADLGIRVDAIGIGDEVNPLELEGVAERTRGVFKHFPMDGDLLQILEELLGGEARMEKFPLSEKEALSELLAELRDLEGEMDALARLHGEGKLGMDEYSKKLSELEFRRREVDERIRELRSELSRKLISAQMRLAKLDESSPEAGELRRYIDELKKLLEESETG